mmetsp:Transcript_37437/g.92103  ORF Transcript_37437/g.92103 Transcript_37437/m.92103 type:complete len:207 (+) Transcript_37437:269-889(+)
MLQFQDRRVSRPLPKQLQPRAHTQLHAQVGRVLGGRCRDREGLPSLVRVGVRQHHVGRAREAVRRDLVLVPQLIVHDAEVPHRQRDVYGRGDGLCRIHVFALRCCPQCLPDLSPAIERRGRVPKLIALGQQLPLRHRHIALPRGRLPAQLPVARPDAVFPAPLHPPVGRNVVGRGGLLLHPTCPPALPLVHLRLEAAVAGPHPAVP